MLGEWNGTYNYSEKIQLKYGKKGETGFTIVITEFDGVHFKGTVQDDPETGGTPGQGTVQGTLKNGTLYFVKKMPVYSSFTKSGEKKQFPVEHPPIHYVGHENENGTFQGEWKIKRRIIFKRIPSINKFLFGLGRKTTGTFKMFKP